MTRNQALTAAMLVGCLTFGFSGAAESATAERELASLGGRLDGMEGSLRSLRAISARPSDAVPVEARPLLNRLDTLEKESRILVLRADGIDERLRRLDERLEDIATKAAAVVTEAERRAAEAKKKAAEQGDPLVAAMAVAGIKMAHAALPPAPLKPAAPTNPQRNYDQALRLLTMGQLDDAKGLFSKFLQDNPRHELAANAQYWLGETYFLRRDYAAAGWIFADGYERYSRGKMAAEGLLKLGMSLAHLSKWPEACATFDRLEADFPNAPAYIETSLKEQRLAVGCQ
jgi:tol-pal system protein YbgF